MLTPIVSFSKYTGLPFNDEYCPFTFSVYPSSTMEGSSSTPILLTVGALLFFAFTSAVFLIYDFSVERRLRKVLHTAEKSGAIVASLFPSVVRDRLYLSGTEDKQTQETTWKVAN